MNTYHIFIISFFILLILLSFIPYKYENYNEINLDQSTCMDLLRSKSNSQTLINAIQNNINIKQSFNDFNRSVQLMQTATGPVYYYSDTECVLESDKLPIYNSDNSCRIGNYQLVPTTLDNGIQGCRVNPNNPQFQNMLSEMYDIKNSNVVNYISQNEIIKNNYIQENNRLINQINELQITYQSTSNTLKTMNDTYESKFSALESLRSQYNTLRTSLQTSFGNCEETAAINAIQIRDMAGITQNGVYYINCGNIPRQTYCLMDPAYDGGGWMLLMKMKQGKTFQYNSKYWSTSDVLNTTSVNMDVSDAKFHVFNEKPIRDVMALFPESSTGKSGGSLNIPGYWVWLCKNWNGAIPTTALYGFSENRDATPANPFEFNGFDSSIFSSQTGFRRHVFGGIQHININKSNLRGNVRWGFVFNNEVDQIENSDVWGGIGGGAYDRLVNDSTAFSAGDYFGCCGSEGRNRPFVCYIFGR